MKPVPNIIIKQNIAHVIVHPIQIQLRLMILTQFSVCDSMSDTCSLSLIIGQLRYYLIGAMTNDIITFVFPHQHEDSAPIVIKRSVFEDDERFSFFNAAICNGTRTFRVHSILRDVFEIILVLMIGRSYSKENEITTDDFTRAIRGMSLFEFIEFKQAVGYYGLDIAVEFCELMTPFMTERCGNYLKDSNEVWDQ